jgi:hypothetical protein
MVRVEDGRTVRRWESGEREIPGPVTVIMETAMDFLAQKDEIAQQLERLRSGEMRPSTMSWGNKITEDTASTIARLSDAMTSLDDALTIITRQPPHDGRAAKRVHWYTLKRQVPKFDPSQKDEWSVPGETSCEAALAYFEKYEGFSDGLEMCGDVDLTAEFLLEKREVLRSQSGASQLLRPGELVDSFCVRRV